MIARIHFSSTAKKGKNKSNMDGYVDIHATDIEQAKELFTEWIGRSVAIRAADGVFHPLPPNGLVTIKKASVV